MPIPQENKNDPATRTTNIPTTSTPNDRAWGKSKHQPPNHPNIKRILNKVTFPRASSHFNVNQNNLLENIETVYGTVTTGQVWRFLSINKNQQVKVDLNERYLTPLNKLLGVLVAITSITHSISDINNV